MPRRLLVTTALMVATLSAWSVRGAAAQDRSMPLAVDLSPAVMTEAAVASPRVTLPALPAAIAHPLSLHQSRPAALWALYGTTAAMQALDVRSTLAAFNRGAVEANPLMAGVTRNKAAFIAVKAGIAASTIFAAHSMARHNKLGAILTLVAVDSAYAVIVSHNYQVAHRLQH
jgi:Domain of unknown function (DUF5658)